MRSFINSIKQTRPIASIAQITLLEDDPVDCELIEATLKNGGIESQVLRVSNRQLFLDSLNQNRPNLILADYMLPKFNGLEALELAQSICPQVPFILVSGVLGEEQAIEAMRRGATDYVLKQRLERLVPAVLRALSESQERQERQRIEMTLKQTDNLLQTVVDESPVGIITLSRDKRVMTWNTAAEELYGWSASTIVDCPLPIIPGSQQASCDVSFSQALQGRIVSNHECQHLRKDGSSVDVNLSIAPLHDANDHIYGLVMVAVDITMRKQIESQRLKLLEQESVAREVAESANRLKDEFLMVLSHELRTPLNAILGWSKLIKTGNLKPPVFQKAIDTIERNAIAQTQLIEELLDVSHIIRGQLKLTTQSVDVNRLIHATVDTLRPAIEARAIHVSCDLDAEAGPILADPSRLQQILWNLLSNAIKFTPASGDVAISSKIVSGHLQIRVADSGIGIAPNFLPYVFDYFRQADGSMTRSQGGLGLGLAITRRLIELHGGTIQVESPGLDQGTVFTVALPMRMTQTNRQKTPALNDINPELNGIKTLVVDDEADSLELLTIILEQEGVQIKSAKEAQTALDILESFQPDIIISDIGLPAIDGYDFLQMARSRSPQLNNVPAVALTAYAREEDRQLALAAGYQAHIAKPFDIQEIVGIVHKLTRPVG